MRKVLALIRADWLAASSYRLRMVLSLFSLVSMVVPFYFVGRGLQHVMAPSIHGEGTDYFGFLVVGTAAFLLLATAVRAPAGVIAGGIGNGTLELLLSTPTRVLTLMSGLLGYAFLWTAVRVLIFLGLSIVIGVSVSWERGFVAAGLLLLILLAHLPFGFIAAASVLVFRTPGPLPAAVVLVSGLLGGVYYPTRVVPDWIQPVAELLPLTHGLRALRRTLLDDAGLVVVAGDTAWLIATAFLLLAVSAWLFAHALAHARRNGTLSHY